MQKAPSRRSAWACVKNESYLHTKLGDMNLTGVRTSQVPCLLNPTCVERLNVKDCAPPPRTKLVSMPKDSLYLHSAPVYDAAVR